MERKTFADGVYHVMNRGVDKRKIFLDDKDRFRFIHDLFEFNDTQPAPNLTYRFHKNAPAKSMDIVNPYIEGKHRRELLVEILAFVIMPNHYHLLLRPRSDDVVSQFMKKLNIGYAKYFNEKYNRTGALFEGRYKFIPVVDQPHFLYLPYYIHLNPLDLVAPEWREKRLTDVQKAIRFLESYRWSSHFDYAGKKNFPSITQRAFLEPFIGNGVQYQNGIKEWLQEMDLSHISDLMLE